MERAQSCLGIFADEVSVCNVLITYGVEKYVLGDDKHILL